MGDGKRQTVEASLTVEALLGMFVVPARVYAGMLQHLVYLALIKAPFPVIPPRAHAVVVEEEVVVERRR